MVSPGSTPWSLNGDVVNIPGWTNLVRVGIESELMEALMCEPGIADSLSFARKSFCKIAKRVYKGRKKLRPCNKGFHAGLGTEGTEFDHCRGPRWRP